MLAAATAALKMTIVLVLLSYSFLPTWSTPLNYRLDVETESRKWMTIG